MSNFLINHYAYKVKINFCVKIKKILLDAANGSFEIFRISLKVTFFTDLPSTVFQYS